jgi:hypothetical protein
MHPVAGRCPGLNSTGGRCGTLPSRFRPRSRPSGVSPCDPALLSFAQSCDGPCRAPSAVVRCLVPVSRSSYPPPSLPPRVVLDGLVGAGWVWPQSARGLGRLSGPGPLVRGPEGAIPLARGVAGLDSGSLGPPVCPTPHRAFSGPACTSLRPVRARSIAGRPGGSGRGSLGLWAVASGLVVRGSGDGG